jgi:hypothetical protein
MKMLSSGALALAVAMSWAARGTTEEWGSLKGQFVYEGSPFEPKKLTITKDQEECCKHNLVDESLLVGAEGNELRNVVVFLAPAKNAQVPIHPDLEATANAERKLDNLSCRFDPRIVTLWTKQTLIVGNSDPIGHNALIDTVKNPPLNVTIPSGGSLAKTFAAEERIPVPVSCSIHPWMRGWLLIRDNPYMAVTDKEGRFELQHVPVGTWEFVFWHERATYLTEVTIDGKLTQWRRGRAEIAIDADGVDLGVIKVAAKHFK